MKGYTVTADYAGTVSRHNLNKIRYVAIFEGTALDPAPGENTGDISDPSAPPDQTDPTGQETQTGEKNRVLRLWPLSRRCCLAAGRSTSSSDGGNTI